MVGDNPEADVIGGKKINAITFQKLHKGIVQGINEQEPDVIFDNFIQLNHYIQKLFKNKHE